MTKLKKAIVFGGSGFLGSHVADSLTEKGFDVTIFDIKKSSYLQDNQEMIVGDILDTQQLDDVIKGHDIVYNFAGIADIDECHKRPIDTIKYNILGNGYILESAARNKVKKYLFASSAYVYSSSGSFYRISKQSSELFVESFTKENNMNYIILRYGSLYGDRADNRNSLHRMIANAIKKKKIDYQGDGNETREYIHVKDAADLSVEALNEKYNDQILMLTGAKSIKYGDLLEMIKEMFQNKVEIVMHANKSKTHYKMSPYSFNPKMAKKLVCNPHIDLGQGILNLIGEIHSKLNSTLNLDHDVIIKD
jgi:UDP-glucose 4-epimerase